jgi:hypothetical protein
MHLRQCTGGSSVSQLVVVISTRGLLQNSLQLQDIMIYANASIQLLLTAKWRNKLKDQ